MLFICDFGFDSFIPYSSEHRFTHGCDNSKQFNPDSATPASSGPVRNFLCSYGECPGAESIKIVCPYCERNYCLKHRHADEHSCENLPERVSEPKFVSAIPPAPSTATEKPVAKAKPAVVVNEVDRQKMDKILIMKLKMNAKATADVPPAERMFLFVESDDLSERKAVVRQPPFQFNSKQINRKVKNVFETALL
ncbi:AN1-type zinc finger protein 1 [Trichostrongylus colubriformis]|uniref:AN1-type zinc finger protein 1 n=1 Tax=Trichostrongylus colubriformis TaxID=6319 RepID=A0AAN8F7Y9_TRICO